MDRLTQTVRIVTASLKNNPHTKATDVPDLIKTVWDSLPNIAMVVPAKMPSTETIIEPEARADEPAMEAPVEPVGEQDAAEATQPKKSWGEALAASRARFGGGQAEAEQSEGEPVATTPTEQAEGEAEVEAHAS